MRHGDGVLGKVDYARGLRAGQPENLIGIVSLATIVLYTHEYHRPH